MGIARVRFASHRADPPSLLPHPLLPEAVPVLQLLRGGRLRRIRRRAFSMRCCAKWNSPRSAAPLQPQTIYFGGGTPSALTEIAARIPARRPARAARSFAAPRVGPRGESRDDPPDESAAAARARRHAAEPRRAIVGRRAAQDARPRPRRAPGGGNVSRPARSRIRQPEHRPDVCRARPDARAVAGDARQDDRARARARLVLLPDLRGRHRVFPQARSAATFGRTTNATRSFSRRRWTRSPPPASPNTRSPTTRAPATNRIHNQAYWLGADYLGFGPSAFSTRGLHRWKNIPDTAEYTRRILAGENRRSALRNTSPSRSDAAKSSPSRSAPRAA